MATPFSPFIGRHQKPVWKRRQSELPSDLIDWEAPEIPELDKQRIIYEDYIKELNEDHDIESLLNEQIFQIAHDTVVEEYKSKVKKIEDEITKERSRVHLLLGQIKMFETNVQSNEERIDELENEVATQRDAINKLKSDKENWLEEKENLQMDIENLNFRNNEINCELKHNIETFGQKKKEAESAQASLNAIRTQLSYYKKLAKSNQAKIAFE